MAKTPERRDANVLRLSSPRTPTATETVATVRIRQAIAEFVQNFETWPMLVAKGNDTCRAIGSQLKGNLLAPGDGNSSSHYADPLPARCQKLDLIVTVLGQKVVAADQMILALKDLSSSCGPTGVVGRSWTLTRALQAMAEIIGSFKEEIEVRRITTENIGHSISYPDLVRHVCMWEHLIGCHSRRVLTMKMLSHEFGCS